VLLFLLFRAKENNYYLERCLRSEVLICDHPMFHGNFLSEHITRNSAEHFEIPECPVTKRKRWY